MKSVFLCKNKNRVYLRDQKAGFFTERGPAALGGVGRGAVPCLGGTQKKGGAFSAECPLNGAGVHSPAGPPGLRATAARGAGGPHPAPYPGSFLALSPQMCGDFGGKGGRHKGAREVPSFSR